MSATSGLDCLSFANEKSLYVNLISLLCTTFLANYKHSASLGLLTLTLNSSINMLFSSSDDKFSLNSALGILTLKHRRPKDM
jgi:hypothetical protein